MNLLKVCFTIKSVSLQEYPRLYFELNYLYNYQINVSQYLFKYKSRLDCTRCTPAIVNRVKDNLRSPEIFKSFFSCL